MILRAEKGYIVVGKDTDGTTMPHDLGVAGPRERAQGRIHRQAVAVHADRQRQGPQAVGRPERRGRRGAAADRRACGRGAGKARRSLGYVTSSYMSPTLGRPVALGLVETGFSRMGEAVGVYHLGAERRAAIAPAVAFDPEGKRLHA